MRAVLDTSVLIDAPTLPAGIEAAISAVSIAELHFGLLVARDDDTRAERATQLGVIEANFSSLPLDDRVARVLGQLKAAVTNRGGNPRRRMADLAIAATAVAHGAVLITGNAKDLEIVKDLVTCRELPA
jgi:toxin FitB